MYAGSSEVAELVVTPFDGTTAAALTVTNPAGVTAVVVPSTADAGHTWTATVAYPAAGRYVLVWTVTGTGARKAVDEILIDPIDPRDRSYATSTDLAHYTGVAPPPDADRLLARATQVIDRLLLTSWYAVDADGEPTHIEVIAALKQATCAQVAWWVETGDEAGIGGVYQSVSIGNVSMSRGGQGGGSSGGGDVRLSGEAFRILANAGLTAHAAWLW